jgi:amino acid transporter
METTHEAPKGHGFGTFPVFLAAISTILGAIMFLRFGWAVGHVGVWGALGIVLVGHIITIPTALAISEIATNRKVEGGGEYFIISRSFGTNIGASIGIALYISQAISVAFYLIAFAHAFQALYPFIQSKTGIAVDPRMFSIPMGIILSWVVIKYGASTAVYMLYSVVVILGISLLLFFLGGHWDWANVKQSMSGITGGYSWTFAFAVCFPAFTGMTAGVGLSGDLKNPRRSIPLGTLIATIAGALVYILIILKLGMNVTPDNLAADELIMAKIALWGPIIPIGLAAATLSSAIGSLLIAPRTMQALSSDKVFPSSKVNTWLSKGKGDANEPLNATYLTIAITMGVIILGDINVVAKIVSQFFMVTYGALCLISVLEHFAASPSYRPSFRSRWWISLIGAIGCFTMMIMMEIKAAIFAVTIMGLIYISVKRTKKDARGIAILFKGALYQMIRRLQVWLQKNRSQIKGTDWRPSFVAVSHKTFERIAAFNLLSWIAHRHGFGTYFHYIPGFLTKDSRVQSRKDLERVINLTNTAKAGVYSGTIISPSFTTAVAQIIQVPGVAGMDNNGLILEFPKDDISNETELLKIQTGVKMGLNAEFNVCVMRSSDYNCGYKKTIHLWLTRQQLSNANLMILLAYIIMGHPDWSDSEISVYAAMPEKVLDVQKKFLEDLIQEGRIPISKSNITILPFPTHRAYEDLVHTYSFEADLVIVGFTPRQFNKYGYKVFTRFPKLRDVVFVTAEEDEVSLVELEEDESIDEHEMEETEESTPEAKDSVVTNLDKSEAEPQIEKPQTPPGQKEEIKPPQKLSETKEESEIRMTTKMGIKTITPKEDVDSNVKTSKIDTDMEKKDDD